MFGFINILILYSVSTEYTKYVCNIPEDKFLKDTFIYQVPINQGCTNMKMRLQWKWVVTYFIAVVEVPICSLFGTWALFNNLNYYIKLLCFSIRRLIINRRYFRILNKSFEKEIKMSLFKIPILLHYLMPPKTFVEIKIRKQRNNVLNESCWRLTII